MLYTSEGLTFGLRPNALGLRSNPFYVSSGVGQESMVEKHEFFDLAVKPLAFGRSTTYTLLSLLVLMQRDTSSSVTTALLNDVVRANKECDMDKIAEAIALAQSVYGNRVHWTGVTVFEHVMGVLEELLPFEPDEEAILACILHHVLEDGALELSELEDRFGASVRTMVSSVHLLSQVAMADRRKTIQDMRLMLVSVSEDVRTVMVMLCDRCHVLKFVDRIPSALCKRVCMDILQLYGPVAARLCIYSLKHQLESGAFPYVYPLEAERIADQWEISCQQKASYLGKLCETLSAFFDEQGVATLIESREKQPYSIFSKMTTKGLTHIDQVYDLFAIRVVVENIEDCYRVLGLLHLLGRPVPNRFKDYIAFEKPNGYQSLHTTLTNLRGLPSDFVLEIQIRTHEMHRRAKFGIAAHWSYKQFGSASRALEQIEIHNTLLSQESVGIEEGQSTFVDHIYVLTPKGDVIELPEGATPLDFAFQVHTQLGLSFRSARVNGTIVPITYQLENGDVVEILKHPNPQPSPNWMQLLKMSSSKSKLRRYFADREPKEEKIVEELPEKKAAAVIKAVTPEVPVAHLKMEEGLEFPSRCAKCCKPTPNVAEEIVGVINRKGQVMIHKRGCGMIKRSDKGRRVRVWWEE